MELQKLAEKFGIAVATVV